MQVSSYAVRDQKGRTIGRIDRQGEDSRLIDPQNDTRIRSFFPWDRVIAWAKENNYTLIEKSVEEPVAVIGE